MLLKAPESDFDGDGKSDLLWRNATSGANTIWKSGASTSAQSVLTVADPAWKIVGVGDFNADGKSDIVWRHSSSGLGSIWHGADSANGLGITTLADQAWKLAGVGDFDGDGQSDLLWRNGTTWRQHDLEEWRQHQRTGGTHGGRPGLEDRGCG